MKKLLVFSVSILCLSLALAVVLHQFAEFAIARSTAPMPTEVVTRDGVTTVFAGNTNTVALPTYSDGTSAAVSECDAVVSPLLMPLAGSFNMSYSVTSSGLMITSATTTNAGYLIVCTRAAGGAVAAHETTWGQVKSLYAN